MRPPRTSTPLQAGCRGGAVGDQQPAGLAVPLGCRRSTRSSAATIGRRPEVAGNTEVVAQVPGADEQHVHSVDCGDLLDLLDGLHGLDLHDAEHLAVGPVEGAGIQTETAGPVGCGDTSVAMRREAQVAQRLLDLGRGVHPGSMTPAAPRSSTRPSRIRAAVSTRTTVGTP